MRLISWNVNGIRACINKGFYEFLESESPDVLCIQESKMQEGQIELVTDGYYQYFNSAEKKGYSGTITLSKKKPLSVSYGMDLAVHDKEGRMITLEYDTFYLVNVYTPNSQEALKRLSYRMEWEKDFKAYVKGLEKNKPVIICGDLNVAHKEIDLKNPTQNRKNAGFSDEERAAFTALLDAGFIDTYRLYNPDKEGAYSWWSYRFNARSRNAGWRIDYFLVSESLKDKCENANILNTVLGSDHCPVTLEIEVS
ncbi:exodeoxyribonuclease-3 [Breznakia sp. PF5-3]|uniref:exodeoxyribonuclease III n=1 Tax=unclassified Breznakia TaxID=2623764 RepID=UPI0024073BEF|nr:MULTISPECIES: exodeoxyribonuclease III [unclassified Breznakia]MDL2276925.1 exodeoxyribonuclease III [Breznakia sp. OttesenSCG-928-G09]MDF9825328.1 exodeoxyribonuclease-3 [Breznakia sp. PM6-1]MDF9836183.1 exodeoxyribonuclease-3 [Breznakia sp. PF5-3]MDF9838419.1 exodeoxyribonuclease-3 [Breznakia sp. PFB2-8]MDF9860435.1 exodeoxyribonuclease-3 [Breznakia sp. PH5-24]